MNPGPFIGIALVILHVLIQIALVVRALLRPNREPASRIAWIVVILVVPALGIIAYILLGETTIGRHRVARMTTVLIRLPDVAAAPGWKLIYARICLLRRPVNGWFCIIGCPYYSKLMTTSPKPQSKRAITRSPAVTGKALTNDIGCIDLRPG